MPSTESQGMYVTKQWVIGVLLMLVATLGGYVLANWNSQVQASASELEKEKVRVTELEKVFAEHLGAHNVVLHEIDRRLGRIEHILDSSKRQAP